MNKRIKELAEQAANEYLSEMESVTDTLSTAKRDELAQKAKQAGIGIIPHGFSEKFAELIVQECAKISLECGINLNREDFRQGISRNIKQHFGVEE